MPNAPSMYERSTMEIEASGQIMPKRLAGDAASSRWPDLPFDLLRDISCRLHAAVDFVRFHAVCKPWRDTRTPAPCRPALLPWLLAPRPRDATGHQAARCIFSSKSRRRRATAAVTPLRDRRWVVSADDGAAAWFLATCPESSGLLDPLTGSAATSLPPYPDKIKSWVERLEVGHGLRRWHHLFVCLWSRSCPQVASSEHLQCGPSAPRRCHVNVGATFVIESHGELLWAWVQVDIVASSLSLSVYALQEEEGGEPKWVKRDGRSLADRVLFLGRPSSFAVDAVRLGMSGGCAYLVPRGLRRVCKYSFHVDESEFVAQLPAGLHDDEAWMWITPQPAIAPTEVSHACHANMSCCHRRAISTSSKKTS
ncbi:uncharacterized protein LOC133900257 [Phragmites australis]|uniref:uncharacterized protein LOC133900257 n=1 Tax=Phragmites australis TaxID=29695 RepID=UPI002D792CE4|nr:uncharacterized protein LOC133900257 [Phragmites australis]